MATPRASARHHNAQLVLPLPEWQVPPPGLPPDAPSLPLPQLWTSLSPTLQAHVRQTLLRIIQEVLANGTSSGQDHCPAS
jgi:hypothetical protein